MATFTDDFNRADNADLGATWDGGYAGGFGSFSIVSNKIRVAADAGADIESYNGATFTDNQYGKITIATFNGTSGAPNIGPALRVAAPTTATFYRLIAVEVHAEKSLIGKVVAGAFTTIASEGVTAWAATDTIEGRALGSNLILLRNGSSLLTGTDTAITSGRIGIYGGSAIANGAGDVEGDNFEGGDFPAVSHRASQAGSGNTTTSITLTIPASTVADDIVIAAFTNGGATADPSVSDDEGAGSWAKILSGDDGGSNLSVWWKRATSNTASKTITASGFTNSCTGVCSVYSGALTSGNPYGGQTYQSNASGTESHAAITPTVDGSMVFLVVGNQPDLAVSTQAATSPAVLLERAEHLSTGGLDSSVCLASEVQVTAGSTGALTWAQTNAASMSIAFYLTPQASGPTIETGVGNAAGTSTASATSKATKKAAGSAAGTSTAAADGQSTHKAVGSAAGTSTASAVGQAVTPGVGAAAGTSTAAATGLSTHKAAGNAAGTSTAAAESKATKNAVASAAGTSTAAAVGLSTHKAVGSAAGTSTAEAVGEDAGGGTVVVTGVGAADGTSTAAAVGLSTHKAAAQAAGTSTAAAIARAFALAGGSSQGICTAAAIALAINKAVASAAGTGLAEAVGEDAAAGTGLNDGDEVMVIQSGGIECSVFHDTGTLVSVATASATQISVVQAGGAPIRVTI